MAETATEYSVLCDTVYVPSGVGTCTLYNKVHGGLARLDIQRHTMERNWSERVPQCQCSLYRIRDVNSGQYSKSMQ